MCRILQMEMRKKTEKMNQTYFYNHKVIKKMSPYSDAIFKTVLLLLLCSGFYHRFQTTVCSSSVRLLVGWFQWEG